MVRRGFRHPGAAKLAGSMASTLRRAAAAVVVLVLAACGGGANPSATACVTPAPPPAPSAVAAPVSAVASSGRVDPGATVSFTVTATGPAQIHFDDCTAPLRIIVADQADDHIFSGQSVPISDPARCPTAALGAGQSLTTTVSWPVDPTLPGGVYTAVLMLGDAPQLSLSVAVGAVRC